MGKLTGPSRKPSENIVGEDHSPKDDLEAVDKYDFSAWSSFRSSFFVAETSPERVPKDAPLLSPGDESNTKCTTTDADRIKGNFVDARLDSVTKISSCAAASSLQLTDEERRDNAAWRLRIICGPTFSRDYAPSKWEKKEMEDISEFLELKNPSQHPDYLDSSGDQITKNAISSLFFAKPSKQESVLLKRGPVLLGGAERSLMVFTCGFLFFRVELDTLINLLLDIKPEGVEEREGRSSIDRFSDIDTGQSGSLDRCEIRDFFKGTTGIRLSSATLDRIMERFDCDSDGTVSLDEFRSLFDEAQEEAGTQRKRFSFKSLASMLRKNNKRARANRTLDTAYLMADIEKIENGSVYRGKEGPVSTEADGGESTLVVYIKEEPEPMIVKCAKPGQAEAWMEVFRTCMTSLKSQSRQPTDELQNAYPGVISGLKREAFKTRKKKDRLSRARFASSVQWGDDDDTDSD